MRIYIYIYVSIILMYYLIIFYMLQIVFSTKAYNCVSDCSHSFTAIEETDETFLCNQKL